MYIHSGPFFHVNPNVMAIAASSHMDQARSRLIFLVTMAVDDTEILNFTWLNDENYSLWVVHMEADLVCCIVAMVTTDVFKKQKKRD
jgi:hypothetical protein